MHYLDFDVEITPGTGREYPLVVHSVAGDARGVFRFPYDELTLRDTLKDLRIALLQSIQTYRAITPEEQTVKAFGQALYEALFTGAPGSLFYECRSKAEREGLQGVRLRLHIQTPDLAALPWEYLYDPRQDDFLCLSRDTPVVRYPELAQPLQPLQVTPPMRILAMIANPSDQDRLDSKREKARLEEALKELTASGLVELTWLPGQTWADLQEAMWRGPWHIFHFSGHGGYDPRAEEGVIAFCNEGGRAHLLYARDLARLVTTHHALRLVVLNACEGAKSGRHDLFSSTAATLARRGIPAVLAMQEQITDAAAIQLTRTFYRALANGLPVDAAVVEARTAISVGLSHSLEWGTPILYLRAPDSTLFTVTGADVQVQKEAVLDGAQEIRQTPETLLHEERTQNRSAPEEQPPVPMPKKRARPAPFPPVWNVPYRYSFFFTGRDQEVEHLFETFTAENAAGTIPIQALSGLGGLGKTQTAVEYAYRYRQKYQAVLWMRAETQEDLLASFRNCAELLHLPTTSMQQRESLLASMYEWFLNTADWLLILDNADNLALVEPFLPTSAQGHILLTTRAAALGALAQTLALTKLVPEDGALCLLRRADSELWGKQLSDAKPARVKAALELTRLMDGLPLALEQAGAYIESTGSGVSEYLDLYHHFRTKIQSQQQGVAATYPEPVAFAWSIARASVQRENPAAIELLHLCAFLAPESIPFELFSKGASVLGPTLGPVAADGFVLNEAIALLRKHSLIKREVDHETETSKLIIHSVMQEILQDSMDPPTQRLWAQRAVSAVAAALPVVAWQILRPHVRRCLSWTERWEMSFPEASLLRQRGATEDL